MKEQIYKITHYYDKKPQYSIKIVSKENPKKFALYVQFMAEKWFDEGISLNNLVIADVLIKFYGCRLPTDTEFCQKIKNKNIIDMYWDRESIEREEYYKIIKSDKFQRDGLKKYLQNIQNDGEYLGELKYPKHYSNFKYFKNLSLPEQKYIFEKTQYALQRTERDDTDF